MITKNEYPVLEFDDDLDAVVSPFKWNLEPFSSDKMIITFFPEVMNELKENNQLELERLIEGENPVEVYRFKDQPDILITLGYVGCPACAGNLEFFAACGVKKVIFCGGGGVLDKNIKVGTLLVVEGAIRDEGFSYRYIKPSRYIYTDKNITKKISDYLEEHKISYLTGITWTTDAMFRETKALVEQRKAEGAKIVEMEQAGCIAVAQFRNFDYGAIIYGGDDVSQEEWNTRSWNKRKGIRYNLVTLCKELVSYI
ncbi:MAG: nucleoside phosphorylase [Spirochaetales bacterium]|nr:nucleoside phosphorylase [Spirochaetales bacterium]